MRKELLNHRPTSALRGQSPLCESVGTGHTSTHPSIFTKVLLVLLTMLLLPSTAWGQETITYTFTGTAPEGVSEVNTSWFLYESWRYLCTDNASAVSTNGSGGVTISVRDNDGKSILYPTEDNIFVNKVTLNYASLEVTEGSKVYVRAVNRTDTTTHYSDPCLITSGGSLDINIVGNYIVPSQNLSLLIFSNDNKAYSYNLKSITITKITDYNISIGDVSLTGSNVTPGTGAVTGLTGVYFTPADTENSKPATLTLNNANLGTSDVPISITTSLDALTINLAGTNSLSGNITYSGSASESTLTFSGTGTLTVSNESQSVFNGFTSVTPDNGLYIATNHPYILSATSATISTTATYPIWVGNGELDGNSYTQVTATNFENILEDEHKSVSYDRNGELTLKGAVISAASDYPGIFVGDITSLTVHLVGYSSLSGGFYFMENTNLNVTTSTTMPGKIVVSSNVATWASGKTGEVNCSEPLKYESGTISIEEGSSLAIDYFTGFSTQTGENEFSTSGNNYYNAPDANEDNNVVKIALPTGGATSLWASILNNIDPSLIKKVYFQFDWGACTNKNVKVQIKGIKQEIIDSAPVWEDDGKVYSEAVSLSDTNDGIVEIELTKNLPVSDLIQLEFSSEDGEFSFVVLGVGYEEAKTYLIVDETPITETNYKTAFGTENISFTPPSDGGSAVLSLKGDITIGESGGNSSNIQVYVDDLTIEINGSNTINGSIEYKGDNPQSSSIQINKADEATSPSLTMNNIEDFGTCTWGDGLYLSASDDSENSVDVRYEFEDGRGAFCSYYGDISTVTISATPSYSLWINGIQATEGNVTGTGIEKNGEDVSESEWGITFTPATNTATNTLLLKNVRLTINLDHTPAIISGLDNLNIQIEGTSCINFIGTTNGYNYGGYIAESTKSATELTITAVDEKASLSTTNSADPYISTPFHGFSSVTYDGDLIYLPSDDSQYILNLASPSMSSLDGRLNITGGNEWTTTYYTIDYVYDSEERPDVKTATPYDPDNQPVISNTIEIYPCTATAYLQYEYDGVTKTSQTVTGKLFEVADKTIVFNSTSNVLNASDLKLSPAIEEGDGVSINDISDAYNENVISYNEDTGIATIVGIGSCNVEVGLSVDDDASIQVLNPADGEVRIAKGEVTIIPDKPSIVKDAEHDYLNTDKITIEGEDADNFKIFYIWSDDDVEIDTYWEHKESDPFSIYNGPIPAQSGTLRAWVGYDTGGDRMYYTSDVVSEAFTVKTDISEYTVQGLATPATYTGAAIVPEFTVVDKKETTLASTNYTVSYQSVEVVAGDEGSGPSINYTDVPEMVKVGSYRIVITGTGDSYGGSTYANFAITKANLNIVTIENIADQTYTGSEIKPEITVKLNGNTLSASDYGFSIGYSNNINVATSTSANAPTVTITATEGSNYFTAGTTQFAHFNIVQKSLTDESISVTLSASSFTYNGDLQEPEITVKDGETTLTTDDYGYSYYQDGEAVDGPASAGTYTLTISGKGNYTGEITKEITITPKEIATANITVTLATTSYTYDGTAHTPGVSSVTISDVTDPIEYENIVYTNNVNAALATATENAPTVTVSLKGNYSGTGVATFTIEQADLSDYVVTGLTTPTAYTGSPITPTFSVKATETAETSLTANTDYSVKYQQAGADVDEMKDAGDYKIVISGEGNYKGSLDADFTIDRAQLNLTINLEGWAYGDTPNEPSLEGNLGEGDITWQYKAAGAEAYSAWSTLTKTTDAGTYMVKATVAETDNYEGGSKEAEFVIEQLDISQADITLDNNELTYNGEQQTVNVTKVMAGDIEVPVDCYEVSGNTGKEAGDYKLTVTAKTMDSSGNPIKNNFTGSAEKDWKIKNRTVTTDELGLSENQSQATYYSETEDLEVPEGVVAYIITGVNGNNVVTQRIRYIKKSVAVFVEQTTSTENPLEVIPDASELPLKGTAVDLNVASISGGTVYVLYKGEFVKSTTGTIPAKRCYLLLPNNVAAGTRAFGIIGGGSDGSTAIKSINDEPSTIDNWYDMGGHRIEKPTKAGLYIKNGKKVVIK